MRIRTDLYARVFTKLIIFYLVSVYLAFQNLQQSTCSVCYRILCSNRDFNLAANYSNPQASSASRAYVEIRTMKNYGNWLPLGETPGSVLTMISNVRTATNMNLNLYAIVGGPQPPGQTIKGSTLTVDDFLLQAKQAAGGQVYRN